MQFTNGVHSVSPTADRHCNEKLERGHLNLWFALEKDQWLKIRFRSKLKSWRKRNVFQNFIYQPCSLEYSKEALACVEENKLQEFNVGEASDLR